MESSAAHARGPSNDALGALKARQSPSFLLSKNQRPPHSSERVTPLAPERGGTGLTEGALWVVHQTCP